jgi:Tfp pilus assembly protein PilV
MRAPTTGLTLTETLLSTVLIVLILTAFAAASTQAARTVSGSQLTAYAADALQAAAQAIARGNPQYTQTRTLSAADLQLLASQDGRRAALRPALTGTITAQAGDPPR